VTIEKISLNLVLKPNDELRRVNIIANNVRRAVRKSKIKRKLKGKLVVVVNRPIVSNEMNRVLIKNLIDTKNKMNKIKFLCCE
jgi:hypothetical protein